MTVLADALEHLVRGIVDHPDDVQVELVTTRRGRTLEVRVHPEDLGKVIGRGGRTATALRTVVGGIGGPRRAGGCRRHRPVAASGAGRRRHCGRTACAVSWSSRCAPTRPTSGSPRCRADRPPARRAGPTLTVESPPARTRGGCWSAFVEAPDRDAAEALRGARLLIDAARLGPTGDPDEFHVHQLEGLRAELADGSVVGTVREVVHGPGGELLVLARPDAPDALVPFVAAIVPTVDLAGGRVVLTPPDGLLDAD